jgi:ethanolamine utilization protein EutP (predicted NTPase)
MKQLKIKSVGKEARVGGGGLHTGNAEKGQEQQAAAMQALRRCMIDNNCSWVRHVCGMISQIACSQHTSSMLLLHSAADAFKPQSPS